MFREPISFWSCGNCKAYFTPSIFGRELIIVYDVVGFMKQLGLMLEQEPSSKAFVLLAIK